MQAKNITKEDAFKGQGAEKVVADILHSVKTLGSTVSYYQYDINTEQFENAVVLPVYIQEIPKPEEGVLLPDREVTFVFSTESFVDNSIIPTFDKDKAVYNGVTYELVDRSYVNAFAHVATLLENSILVSFKAIKRTLIKRSEIL